MGRVVDAGWLAERYPKMTDIHELLDDHEREFGWRPTERAVYVRAFRLGIGKVPVGMRIGTCERKVVWSKEPEMEAWMLEHDRGQRIDRLSEEFRERFGFGLTRGQIGLFRASHGLRFHEPHGGRRTVPVGTERPYRDGYTIVKVAERPSVPQSKDDWKLKHVLAWERANGMPVPKDHVVLFADRDKSNFDPQNLVAVPRRLVAQVNTMADKWHDRDTLLSVIAIAELRCARSEALARLPRTCPCCGATFTNEFRRTAGNLGATTCPACAAKGKKPPTCQKRRAFSHERIRELCASGMSQKDVASIVGCSQSTVSLVLRREGDEREEGK